MPLNDMKTWANGELVTAAQMNAEIRDPVNALTPGHQVLTTAQKTALTGVVTGTMVYDSTLNMLQYWNGSAWLNTNGVVVPPTIYTSGGGLTANSLGLVPFTSVSDISLNNCFSSNYNAYSVYIRITGSASASVNWVLRSNGVNLTSANSYIVQVFQSVLTSNSGVGGTTGFSNLPIMGTGQTGLWRGTIHNPAAASLQTMGEANGQGSNPGLSVSGFRSASAAAHDGFTLFAPSGTFTGDVRVVGIG